MIPLKRALPVLLVAAIWTAGCGSGAGTPSSASSVSSADATSAATGDIPDNQVFLTYASTRPGYVLRYPEGWTQQGAGARVRFLDKDNTISLRVTTGPAPSSAVVDAALVRLRASEPTLRLTAAARALALPHGRAVQVSYSVTGAADPVSGKRPLLHVDRYVYAHDGQIATLDLATPKGVDNVDAYRMISRSFAWR